MSRVANLLLSLACVALSPPLLACAGSGDAESCATATRVEFSWEKLTPETVRVGQDGIVEWANISNESKGYVVIPAAIRSSFTCDELRPYFRADGPVYRSLPLTSFESETVRLPCPLEPGTYAYEVVVVGAGLGEASATGPEHTLKGTIVVD